jgi:protein-disulfide isomerase
VIYLAYGAFFVLRTVCLMCVLTYIAVVGIFVITGRAASFPMTSLPQRLLRDLRHAATRPLALTLIALFVASAATAIAAFPREFAADGAGSDGAAAPALISTEQQTEVERWFDSQPRAIVPVDPGGAAVTIVKFHDFQCPPCKQSYEQYKPILAKYAALAPGKVKLVTRDFPLDPECNRSTPTGTHLAACEAAVAVRLARQKSEAQADRMEEWLFANQATLTPMGIKAAARDIGGVADFDARYPGALEQVKADTALGSLLNVRATPTFFINGVKIDGGLQPQFLDAIIAHELKKSGR